MQTEIRDGRFSKLIEPNVEVKKVASGFVFTEGPIWHPVEHHLIFSDIPGNIMRKWDPKRGVSTYRQPSNMANGNAYDRQGRIVTCEHATSSVSRTAPDGTREVLASHIGDKELNSPNDIVVKSDGPIYFTDPDYGRREFFGIPRDKQLRYQGVYRLSSADNGLELLLDDFEQPNGLCFSPDESRLYVNDTPRGHIRVFDLGRDGSIGEGRVFAHVSGDGDGAPDGMKCDSAGNVYCTGPGGIHVFDPDGNALGVVLVPEVVANFAFGGAALDDVYVTASTSLYRFNVKVPGLAQF